MVPIKDDRCEYGADTFSSSGYNAPHQKTMFSLRRNDDGRGYVLIKAPHYEYSTNTFSSSGYNSPHQSRSSSHQANDDGRGYVDDQRSLISNMALMHLSTVATTEPTNNLSTLLHCRSMDFPLLSYCSPSRLLGFSYSHIISLAVAFKVFLLGCKSRWHSMDDERDGS
jgi:hypothetical protein